MKKFNAFCRYIGYATISVFIGYVSYLGGQKYDYLFKISGNLVPILISLLVFYVTIFGSILKELICYKNRTNADTSDVLKIRNYNRDDTDYIFSTLFYCTRSL